MTVNATTSAAPPAEQALWLRYTTNAWSSSTVAKMTGSGTGYSAVIPAQADGTAVQYYVFSSGDVGSIAGGDADLMTINADTNGGSNYSYMVGSANPITDAQALWVDTRVIAWNGTTAGVTQYRLLYDPDGAISHGLWRRRLPCVAVRRLLRDPDAQRHDRRQPVPQEPQRQRPDPA